VAMGRPGGEGGAPKVSIIIPCKDAEATIGRVLEQVFSQHGAPALEVVVVDSGSTDGTLQTVSRFPVRLHQIAPHEFRHGATRNLGARLATGDILVFLNADAIPASRDWLARLIAPLEDRGIVATYGRQIPNPDAHPAEAFFLSYFYPPESRLQRGSGHGLELEDVFFSTANCAIRREAWEAEPFNDAIPISEDQEWSRRILMRGFAIRYVADACVYHSHNYTTVHAFRRFFDCGMVSDVTFAGPGGGRTLAILWRGLRYLAREWWWVLRHHGWLWLMRSAHLDLAKGMGLLLGRLHRMLPAWAVEAMSAHYSRMRTWRETGR